MFSDSSRVNNASGAFSCELLSCSDSFSLPIARITPRLSRSSTRKSKALCWKSYNFKWKLFSFTIIRFCYRPLFESDFFRDVLDSLLTSHGLGGIQALITGLSEPFRHLDKYPPFLQELERNISESHIDRGDLQRSCAVYKDIKVNTF